MHLHNNAWPPRWSAAHARRRGRLDWLALAPALYAEQPNIVFIMADDLGYAELGSYGQKKIRTPNIDRLAADGVVFENAFAQSSWTRPSMATIMTSLYAASHRVMYKTDLLPDEVTTLAEEAGHFRTQAGTAKPMSFAPAASTAMVH